MKYYVLFFVLIFTSCTPNEAINAGIFKIFFLLLAVGLSILIKNYFQSKEDSKIYEFQAVNEEKKEIIIDQQENLEYVKSENITECFEVKSIYWRPAATGILGLICLISFSLLGEPIVGILFLIFWVGLAIYMNKEWKQTHQEYSAINLYPDRIELLPIYPDTAKTIFFNEVKGIKLRSIYEPGKYGIQSKTGCDLIFINSSNQDIFSFDYTQFKNSSRLKTSLFSVLKEFKEC
jgi:hypothetical protein